MLHCNGGLIRTNTKGVAKWQVCETERTIIRLQEPSNALWLSSHFVKKINQARVLLVGSNSVVARAIYGSTQAIKGEHLLLSLHGPMDLLLHFLYFYLR